MTATPILEDLIFYHFAMYGEGVGTPLDILKEAEKASGKQRVTGHPMLILPDVRKPPRNPSAGERILR